jgi:hypothetical protein
MVFLIVFLEKGLLQPLVNALFDITHATLSYFALTPVTKKKFSNLIQAGPFGYIDKGTFFTDSHIDEFPERIEVIYQVTIS